MKKEDWHESVQGYVIDCLDWFDLKRYDQQSKNWDADQWRKAVAIRQGILKVVGDDLYKSDILRRMAFTPAGLKDFFHLLSCNPDELINKIDNLSSVLMGFKNAQDIAVLDYFLSLMKEASAYAWVSPFDPVLPVSIETAKLLIDNGPFPGIDSNIIFVNTNAPDSEIKFYFDKWLTNHRKTNPAPLPKPRTVKAQILSFLDYRSFIEWRLLPAIDFDLWRIFLGKNTLSGVELTGVLFPDHLEKAGSIPTSYKSNYFKSKKDWLMAPDGYSALCVTALKLPPGHPARQCPPKD